MPIGRTSLSRRVLLPLALLVVAGALVLWLRRGQDTRVETVRHAIDAYCDDVLGDRRIGSELTPSHPIIAEAFSRFLLDLGDELGPDEARRRLRLTVVDTGADTPQPRWRSSFGSSATHAASITVDAHRLELWLDCPTPSGPVTLLGCHTEPPQTP